MSHAKARRREGVCGRALAPPWSCGRWQWLTQRHKDTKMSAFRGERRVARRRPRFDQRRTRSGDFPKAVDRRAAQASQSSPLRAFAPLREPIASKRPSATPSAVRHPGLDPGSRCSGVRMTWPVMRSMGSWCALKVPYFFFRFGDECSMGTMRSLRADKSLFIFSIVALSSLIFRPEAQAS